MIRRAVICRQVPARFILLKVIVHYIDGARGAETGFPLLVTMFDTERMTKLMQYNGFYIISTWIGSDSKRFVLAQQNFNGCQFRTARWRKNDIANKIKS